MYKNKALLCYPLRCHRVRKWISFIFIHHHKDEEKWSLVSFENLSKGVRRQASIHSFLSALLIVCSPTFKHFVLIFTFLGTSYFLKYPNTHKHSYDLFISWLHLRILINANTNVTKYIHIITNSYFYWINYQIL
jgi:hypothetical protein